MSEESNFVLQVVKYELSKQDASIVGRLELIGDTLSAYDGQMLIQAEVRNEPDYHPAIAHCHFITHLGKTSFSGPLDACIAGIDADRKTGLTKAAKNWVMHVGSLLFSLLHAKPVMNAAHFNGTDPWGVPGCHGFVSSYFGIAVDDSVDLSPVFNAGVFDGASALAPPGIVHLAKIVLNANGKQGWSRTLEIDGHDVSYVEMPWECGIPAPDSLVVSQFAVFHYGDQPQVVESRQRLDDAIRYFVSEVSKRNNVNDAIQSLQNSDFDADLVYRVLSFIPIAFCKVMFEGIGITFSKEYLRIKKGGTTELLKFISEPAFARSLGLAPELMQGGHLEAVKSIALASSTIDAINQLLNSGSKPEDIVMNPQIIPDQGVSTKEIERVVESYTRQSEQNYAKKQKKPFWRFW